MLLKFVVFFFNIQIFECLNYSATHFENVFMFYRNSLAFICTFIFLSVFEVWLTITNISLKPFVCVGVFLYICTQIYL